MNSELTPFWHAWRAAQIDANVLAGMPAEHAETLATHDATTRMKAARIVGRKAAIDCTVVLEFRPDGSLGAYAELFEADVPRRYQQSASRWAENPNPSQIHKEKGA